MLDKALAKAARYEARDSSLYGIRLAQHSLLDELCVGKIAAGAFEDPMAVVHDAIVAPVTDTTWHPECDVCEIFHAAAAVDECTQHRPRSLIE